MTQPRAVVVTSVVPYPVTSGGHKRTLRLIETVQRAGVTPHLLTQQEGDPDAVAQLRDRGWTVETVRPDPPDLPARLGQHLARRPSPYVPGLAARVRALAPGAAFVQLEHAQNADYLEAAAPARTVLSLHNVDSEMLASIARGSRGLRRLRMANRAQATAAAERRAVPRADVVIAVSAHDRDHFARTARRVLQAPNGVDDEFFAVTERSPDNEDVVFFGNFDYPPNVLGLRRFLDEGWERLAGRRPGARLVIVGRDLPQALAERVRGDPRMRWAGFVPDVAQALAAGRLSLVPLWHGGGTRLKVLESLAAARPLAATRIGVEGIGVVDGEHGLLADTPEQLADAAATLLEDDALSGRLASAGRALAQRFRWSRALAPAEQLYREWAAATGSSPR